MVKLKKKAGVSKRVRRQHTGALKREWHLPRCARTRQWCNCVKNLICMPTKLPSGSDCCLSVRDCKANSNEPQRHYLVAWSPILRQIVSEAGAIKRYNSEKSRVATIYLFGTEDKGTP